MFRADEVAVATRCNDHRSGRGECFYAADVVEVAPAYDHADITAIAGATVAMYMLGLRAEALAKRR